jgi:ATP-dependent protease ClpP protease subunit
MKILVMMIMLLPAIVLGNITLTETNHVLFKGAVNAKSVSEASKALLKLSFKTKPGDTIYLVLDSPGGSVYAGLDFVQLFATIPRNVECIAIKAHSMAHHFLQACPGKRHGVANVMSMAHRASGGFRGTFNKGDVERQLELWTGIVQGMEKVNAKRMGLSLEKYQSLAKNEYWCHGYDCVKKNFLDQISKVSCSESLIDKNTTTQVNTFFGRFIVESSACPLIKFGKITPIRR